MFWSRGGAHICGQDGPALFVIECANGCNEGNGHHARLLLPRAFCTQHHHNFQ